MYFEAIGHTDIGIRKKSNQDSYCIKIADTEIGHVALIAVADGMGGLAKGELASGHVIRTLSEWFETEFKETLSVMRNSVTGLEGFLTGEWNGIVQKLNLQIMRYGQQNNFNLGTTLTAMLFIGARYSIIHVGDSRAYELSKRGKVKQLTSDQTFVKREVDAGRMTKEEAAVHPKRNVLLQCIGSSKVVAPEVVHGNIKKDSCYLICSDGFRHKLSDKEFKKLTVTTGSAGFKKQTKMQLKMLTDFDMRNGEADNITSVLLHVKKGK